MRKSRLEKTVAIGLLSIACCVLSLRADDLSSPGLYRQNSQRVQLIEAVTPWVVQANCTGADGAKLGDPYAWSGWSAAAKEATTNAAAAGNPYTGGRLLICRETQKRYEIQVLVDNAAGTVTLQPFAFPWLNLNQVPSASRGTLKTPWSTSVALGIPFNRAQDAGADTVTVTATGVSTKLTYTTVTDSAANTTNGVLYPDQTNGSTWYVCTPLHFDSIANYAELPYVVSLGGGATKCIVLGKAN